MALPGFLVCSPGPPATQGICHLERIRLMSIDRVRNAKTTRSEKGFEAGDGICELVRLPQGTLEEVMLGFTGQGGSKIKGPGRDGSGSADGVEVGVENTKESARGRGRLRKTQFAGVKVSVVEGQGEPGRDSGALAGMKAGAEGVEAAT